MRDDNLQVTTSPPKTDWMDLISGAQKSIVPPILQVRTILQKYDSFSKPIAVIASDDRNYVIKALFSNSNAGQNYGMFNDQVAARLGDLINAPVTEVTRILICQEIIDISSATFQQLGTLLCQTAHASLMISDVTAREDGLQFVDEGENRQRFGAMAVFTAWLGASDRQFIYKLQPPRTVYSHDHGHYFPDGPQWTINSLENAPEPHVGSDMQGLGLSDADYATPISALSKVTDCQIAHVLAVPPAEWGVPDDNRAALGRYLARRRDQIIKHQGGAF